jgi:glucosamine--fructose-6-phosphate aminotransferase (isomerizing)
MPEPAVLTLAELASQPAMWRRAAATAEADLARLPQPGQRVLVLGCGTSYYVGEAYARRRIAAGQGRTRAEIPSQLDHVEDDEVLLVISRSGTTGDLVRVVEELAGDHPVTAIVGEAGTPLADLVPDAVLLDYADEESVMQTRFATTGLSVLRRSLGEDLAPVAAEGEEALAGPLPVSGAELEGLRHVVFLGDKWSAALSQEAALKIREAAGFWTEAYPLFEYQHGPISCAGPQTLVWALCEVPDWVATDIEATGARLEVGRLDPQAELVRVHRLAVELALREGRDPDHPPHLNRSVTLAGS